MNRLLLSVFLAASVSEAAVGKRPSCAALSDRLLSALTVTPGYLFSAVRLNQSEFSKSWSALSVQAQRQFSNLEFKSTADLHMTVVYLGEWNPSQFALLKQSANMPALPAFRSGVRGVRLGRNEQVFALELTNVPETLKSAIAHSKSALNGAGLRRPGAYDSQFRAHVTLAEVKGDDRGELQEFEKWFESHIAIDSISFEFNPQTKIDWLLASSALHTGPSSYFVLP